MGTLTVALLQLDAGADQDRNLARGEAAGPRTPAVRAAVAAYHARALGPDSRFVARHRELAAELGMAIAVTYLEAWDPAPRNAVTLIDRHGRDVLTYAKVHTCDFDLP